MQEQVVRPTHEISMSLGPKGTDVPSVACHGCTAGPAMEGGFDAQCLLGMEGCSIGILGRDGGMDSGHRVATGHGPVGSEGEARTGIVKVCESKHPVVAPGAQRFEGHASIIRSMKRLHAQQCAGSPRQVLVTDELGMFDDTSLLAAALLVEVQSQGDGFVADGVYGRVQAGCMDQLLPFLQGCNPTWTRYHIT